MARALSRDTFLLGHLGERGPTARIRAAEPAAGLWREIAADPPRRRGQTTEGQPEQISGIDRRGDLQATGAASSRARMGAIFCWKSAR